jgi:nuclear GTP-binding protein
MSEFMECMSINPYHNISIFEQRYILFKMLDIFKFRACHFFFVFRKMARGDYRKKTLKADFEKVQKRAGNDVTAKKKKKDPGIPDLRKFGAKLEKHVSRKAAPATIQELATKAASRSFAFQSQDANEEVVERGDEGITKKDNSRKAYYKDVILEILDARDPLGCRTREVEEMIMNAGAGKRIILILNKIDLVPRSVVEDWLKYLRNEFPTIAFKSSTQSQRNNLGQSKVAVNLASDALLSGSECVGADNLVKLLKNYCRNLNMKTSITVGVVGFPNVGKSSVINSLKRSKVCNVGSTPGITKVAQAIHLDKNIKLLDCPGIVFSKTTNGEDAAQVLLRNCVKVELLDDPIAPVEVIMSRCSLENLRNLYELPFFSNTNEFLVNYARMRGKLLKGGVPDIENAARAIIQDWNTGKIPFYTVPPQLGISKGAHVSSEILGGFTKEFSLEGFNDFAVDEAPMDLDDVYMDDAVVVDAIEPDSMDTDRPGFNLSSRVNDQVAEIRFKQIVKKHSVPKPDVSQPLTELEQEVNPLGHDQSMKKLFKKSKKDVRRLMKREFGEDMQD